MTEHLLDRPIWHALNTRQSHLAEGEGRALRFQQDHALFAATPDESAESLAAISALVATTGPAIIFQASGLQIPPGTVATKSAMGLQMVAESVAEPEPIDFLELGDSDATEMLALATLTEPGPFFARTHRLGDFIGVRHGGRLVAMAGERLRLPGYTEVSGVCTHPDFRGKGFAGRLMRIVASRIVARGEQPFLHSYADNHGAIALYETLGFRIRSEMPIAFIEAA
ncbi:MAG: GNAT family N-acetyltransferase [Sphingomonadales bacterium]|nr:MAG: GNAT family N-acetyltransferase [Sphingomonadales bacterium]